MNDVEGARCAHCDPVVERRTFGGPSDWFAMVVETLKTDARGRRTVARHFWPKRLRADDEAPTRTATYGLSSRRRQA